LWNLYPDRMIESINWIKNQSIFEALNLYNNKKLAKSILAALKELNFSNIILFNDNDMFRCYHLPELLKPAVSIYYSRDFMLAVDYWRVHGEKMEPELIAKNNVCVANSTYLANYCRKYNPLSFYVGQGCELDMFMHVANTSTPADMQAIQSPIIGYVGALMHIRLDMEVLKHIAQQRPNWQIVLVGPEDEEFKASDLHQLPNIHFLGSKPVADLPQYINAFDVCINPQLVNQVTIGNYPRKIDEYLAVGKPVVATRTEAMSIFKDYTYLADSKEAYVSLIEQALAENNAEKVADRKTFAASHSWKNSVQAIYNAIQSYENPSLQN
ncbi:MAG: glycosyltransferase, partial [Chitinophagaceae bacterium]